MEYHVLSNHDISQIIIYGGIAFPFLWALFGYFAARDASQQLPPKGLVRKVLPWLVLCILISEICLFIYHCINYPWGIDPVPSPASAFREKNEMVVGDPIWGWANDYQLSLLKALSGVLLWFGWTIYSFNFMPSDTSWWKKACKVVGYILISALILGFQLHQFGDLLGYAILLFVVGILLWIAHVKPTKKKEIPVETPNESEENNPIEISKESISVQKEDPLRFMPQGSTTEDIVPTQENEQLQSEISVEKDLPNKEKPYTSTGNFDIKEALNDNFEIKKSFMKHALTYIILRPETSFLCKDEKMDTLWAYKDGDLYCDEEHPSTMGAGAFMWLMQKYKDRETFCWILDILNKECIDLWHHGINKTSDELISNIKQYFPDFKLGNDPEKVKTSLEWTWIDIQSLLVFFRFCTICSYAVLRDEKVVENLRDCSSIAQLTRLYLSEFNIKGISAKEDEEKTKYSEEDVKEKSTSKIEQSKTIDDNTYNNAETEEKSIENDTKQRMELEMMYCKYCGKEIEADSTFCKYCGKRL